MFRLTSLEKVEITLIPLAVAGVWFAQVGLIMKPGELLMAASILLLLQGLCRDAWLWVSARRNPAPAEARYAACMCIESTLGFTGIILSSVFVAANLGPFIRVPPPAMTLAVAMVLVAGYLLKDFVFSWSPWRVYREKNHATLNFRWKG